MTVIGIAERLWRREIHWRAYIGILMLLLLFAFYSSWRDMKVQFDGKSSSPAIRLDVTDVEGREQLKEANQKIQNLETQLTQAQKEAKDAREMALRAEIATQPKPIKERLRACLDSIDLRITEALKTQRVTFSGDVDFHKVEELEKLATEPDASQYLKITRISGLTGVMAGAGNSMTTLGGTKNIEIVVERKLME